MRARLGLALAFVLAVGLLSGCGSTGDSPLSPASGGSGSAAVEESAVAAVVAAVPEVVDDGEFERADETLMDSAPAGALAAIRPLRWWRVINDVERSFTFAFGDSDSTGLPTSAVVTVRKRLSGTFNIAAGTPPPPPSDVAAGEPGRPSPRDSVTILRKPLEDHWVRRILLHRVRVTPNSVPVWRVVASSGVEVTARSATTDIRSLRVQTADFDTTITDPLAFWWLRRLVKVEAGEPVTLTVQTGRNDDVVVLLHRSGRFRFANNGDGTYTGTWRAPFVRGIAHVGVNALSHGTLFDDAERYDSEAWLLPYAVVGHEVAAYMP
jgi:hypothetical protein